MTSCGRHRSCSCWVLACAALWAGTAGAAGALDEERWSMSMLLGGHLPALSALSDGLYKSEFIGDATILVSEGGFGSEEVDVNETTREDFRFAAPLPEVGIAAHAGIEFQWHPNPRHAFLFGMGSMEKTSINRRIGSLPMQTYFANNRVAGERRGKISYTEFTLGWLYSLWQRPKFRLYSRLSVHEVFDIDYREDFVFLFVDSPITDIIGVRRVMVTEAQTASLFMGQLGLGGEWFLRDWLSLGLEGGYLLGERKFHLRDVKLRNDFLAGDKVRLNGLPAQRLGDGTLGYLAHDATPDDVRDAATRLAFYQPMKLAFDGWRVMFRVNFYY